jgi:hypothetical protein
MNTSRIGRHFAKENFALAISEESDIESESRG